MVELMPSGRALQHLDHHLFAKTKLLAPRRIAKGVGHYTAVAHDVVVLAMEVTVQPEICQWQEIIH